MESCQCWSSRQMGNCNCEEGGGGEGGAVKTLCVWRARSCFLFLPGPGLGHSPPLHHSHGVKTVCRSQAGAAVRFGPRPRQDVVAGRQIIQNIRPSCPLTARSALLPQTFCWSPLLLPLHTCRSSVITKETVVTIRSSILFTPISASFMSSASLPSPPSPSSWSL